MSIYIYIYIYIIIIYADITLILLMPVSMDNCVSVCRTLNFVLVLTFSCCHGIGVEIRGARGIGPITFSE